jgi:MOSC domain-containing protein YiiM
MLNLPQRGLASDPDLLNTATRASGADVGVVADVLSAGNVALGDPVRFLD